jgi:hypothetical protein
MKMAETSSSGLFNQTTLTLADFNLTSDLNEIFKKLEIKKKNMRPIKYNILLKKHIIYYISKYLSLVYEQRCADKPKMNTSYDLQFDFNVAMVCIDFPLEYEHKKHTSKYKYRQNNTLDKIYNGTDRCYMYEKPGQNMPLKPHNPYMEEEFMSQDYIRESNSYFNSDYIADYVGDYTGGYIPEYNTYYGSEYNREYNPEYNHEYSRLYNSEYNREYVQEKEEQKKKKVIMSANFPISELQMANKMEISTNLQLIIFKKIGVIIKYIMELQYSLEYWSKYNGQNVIIKHKNNNEYILI